MLMLSFLMIHSLQARLALLWIGLKTYFTLPVDAHVGKALFHGAIYSLRNQGKSVILVTHALHFLSNCDYIYALHDGSIAEHGTYQQLIARRGEFARLDKEFGGSDSQTSPDEGNRTTIANTMDEIKAKSAKASQCGGGSGKLEGRLIVKERRTTGSVSWKSDWVFDTCPYTLY